jgi:predicted dehydrogenase
MAAPEAPHCPVAFVGAGSMSREHLKAFRDVPGVSLAGIHSRTRARAQALAKEFGVPLVADSIAELHAKSKARLVVVSVPELSANAVLKACFEHDWAVLAEKPAGYDLVDAEKIRAEAARQVRRVHVALNRRHYSATRAAQERLAADAGPRFIRIQDQQDQAAALAAGQPAKVVENWMYANSVHVIDYFRVFGRGQVTEVKPVVPWNAAQPSIVVAQLAFASGDIGLYEGIWNGPGPWAVTVSTPSQRLEMRPLEQLGVQKRGERRLDPQPVQEWDTAFKAGFRVQAEKAVAAARGMATDLPTLDDALESMRVVSRIFSAGAS